MRGEGLVIGEIADRLIRSVETVQDGVNEALFEPVVRLGVTGLSRAGKTVFITSLVANLMDRGRMPQFAPASAITAAYLQPQPDDTVPRFDYEAHLAQLSGTAPPVSSGFSSPPPHPNSRVICHKYPCMIRLQRAA